MILICFGTRPEFIKVYPLYKKIPNSKLLYVTQHRELLDDIHYDYILEIDNNTNRLDSIIGSIGSKFDSIPKHSMVLVQGDACTSFGIALACYHRQIPIIHLEAGLRTYDNHNPYPEDVYRRFISTVTKIHFCPTEINKQNLLKDGIKDNIHVVGNTVIDQVVEYNHETSYQNKILITLHRRENWNQIPDFLNELEKLAKDNKNIKFIYPVHANSQIKRHTKDLKFINVIDPMNHKDLCKLLAECLFVISDSGGIQEEASFYGKKVICCRKTTERTEILNTYSFLCPEPKQLDILFYKLKYDPKIKRSFIYGDGATSDKIVDILRSNKIET